MSKLIPKELLTKFRHPSWWKGQGLTKQQALDEMAKTGDFYIDKKINIKKTEIANIGKAIFDRVEIYDDVIKYAGKEKGLYRISPIEKEYFIKQKEYYKKQRKKESERKAKDPKEIAEQIKIELANLEYNLEHSKSELDIALQKYPESVDFWSEKVKVNEKKLLEFKKRHLESKKIKNNIYDLVASGDVDDSIIEAMEIINDPNELIELIEKHIIQ